MEPCLNWVKSGRPCIKVALFLQSGSSKPVQLLLSMGIVREGKKDLCWILFCFETSQLVLSTIHLGGANPSENNHKIQAEVLKKERRKEPLHKSNLSLSGTELCSLSQNLVPSGILPKTSYFIHSQCLSAEGHWEDPGAKVLFPRGPRELRSLAFLWGDFLPTDFLCRYLFGFR